METRPVIKLQLTWIDKVLDFIAILSILFIWIHAFRAFQVLPDTIPVHFNALGKPDAFGRKSTIFILPVIGTIVFIGLTILNRYPHLHKYAEEVTPSSAQALYLSSTRLTRYLKLVILIIFGLIDYKTVSIAGGTSEGLGMWFLPVMLLFIFSPFVYYLVKQRMRQREQ